MFEVGCDDVFDSAERRDLGLDIRCEDDGREYGEGAGSQLDDSTAAADLEPAEAQEGDAEGGDVRSDVADDHDLSWVRGYELCGRLGGHFGFCWEEFCFVGAARVVGAALGESLS